MQQQVQAVAKELLAELEVVDVVDSASPEAQYRIVKDSIDRSLDELVKLNLWGPANRLPSSELWNIAGQVLSRGWLQNQARTKPRGYAGDFEMLAWIYENRLCTDPLGRLFDRYFQAQAAPQAVRNRMKLIADWIVDAAVLGQRSGRTAKIAIVGCAFGLEVRDALLCLEPNARQRLQFTLLDIDPGAIDFAKQLLLKELALGGVEGTSTNLFRIAQRPQLAASLAGSDLIICPGLFDYLDDATAAATLSVLHEQLAARGRLIVFQFAEPNPSRAYMEWIGNWYLIYRNQQRLQSIVERANPARSGISYGAESLHLVLYAMIER
jgi:extracellular factor (EF) 3-hydroxypalmitic acid methyl ester biosynthesis protein